VNRISALSTPEELDLETKREDLRDRRWQRRKSKAFACVALLSALNVGLLFQPLEVLPWM